jgi:hypothetical protein
MFRRRPPLACPQCAAERSRESSWGARLCDACGIEFRPRERIPIRTATPPLANRFGWTTLLIVGIAAAIGVRLAMESPPSSLPPPSDPIVIERFVLQDFDPELMLTGLEPPSVDVVAHRLERSEGRVVATGLVAISDRSIDRPQVHVRFVDSDGVEIGAVLAHVACARMLRTPCPWAFEGSEPAGTAEVRIRASGDLDIGDLRPTARLLLGFDDEFEATTVESNLPEFDATEGRLIPHDEGRELEVRVGVPSGERLDQPRTTLVGYAEGSQVELVVSMPSPVGLSRRIELPEHERAIVRWQLWIEGPLDEY